VNPEAGPKHWRVFDGKRCKVQFQFDPRDAWLGLFWRKTAWCWHLYICLLPFVPLHITILRRHDTVIREHCEQ